MAFCPPSFSLADIDPRHASPIRELVEMFLVGNTVLGEDAADALLRKNYFRVQPELEKPVELDATDGTGVTLNPKP